MTRSTKENSLMQLNVPIEFPTDNNITCSHLSVRAHSFLVLFTKPSVLNKFNLKLIEMINEANR